MKPRLRERRSLAGIIVLAAAAALAAAGPVGGCAGKRLPKVTGPPPEYEPPLAEDAWSARPSTPDLDAAAP